MSESRTRLVGQKSENRSDDEQEAPEASRKKTFELPHPSLSQASVSTHQEGATSAAALPAVKPKSDRELLLAIAENMETLKDLLIKPLLPIKELNFAWIDWESDPLVVLSRLEKKNPKVDLWMLKPTEGSDKETGIKGWCLVGLRVDEYGQYQELPPDRLGTANAVAESPGSPLASPWVVERDVMDRMIRPTEYRILLERLISQENILGNASVNMKALHLCGNPGIGKSLFIDVLASMLLSYQNARRFHVMVYHFGSIILFTRDTSGKWVRVTHGCFDLAKRNPQKFIEFLVDGVTLKEKDRLILLHDVQAESEQPFSTTLVRALTRHFDTYTICVCSTDTRKLNGSGKELDAGEHYFPVLDQNESVCFTMYLSDSGCEDEKEACWRYNTVGGIPRHLKSAQSVQKFHRKLQDAPKLMPSDPLLYGGLSDTNRLVKVVPKGDREGWECMDWLCPEAQRMWQLFHRSNTKHRDLLLEAMAAEKGGDCGSFFERWVREDRIFEGTPGQSNVSFLRREVYPSQGIVQSWSHSPIDNVVRVGGNDFSNLPPTISTLSILWPYQLNFPVIDFVLLDPVTHVATFVQLTVGGRHSFIAERFVLMVSAMLSRNFNVIEFVWAVPPGSPLKPQNLAELIKNELLTVKTTAVASAAPDTSGIGKLEPKPRKTQRLLADAKSALSDSNVTKAIADMKQFICYLSPLQMSVNVAGIGTFSCPVRWQPKNPSEALSMVREFWPTAEKAERDDNNNVWIVRCAQSEAGSTQGPKSKKKESPQSRSQ